jgi:hypothetical protein
MVGEGRRRRRREARGEKENPLTLATETNHDSAISEK